MIQKVKARKWQLLILLICIVVCAFLLQESYPTLMLCYIGIYTIAVSGLDILFGYTGQISFGHAGFFAIGAYTSALLSLELGVPAILTILIGSIVAAGFGIIIAFPASKLVKHFLSVFTIAFGQMVYMFVKATNSLTGGSGGIRDIPCISLFGFQFDSYERNFFLILIIAVVVMLIKKRLIASRTGRAFISIRENTPAANGLGVNVRRYKILAFALSALFTGLAGGLYAHLIGYISPDTFTSTQSTLFRTMLLFGGLGTLFGPVVGSAILLVIRELMQSLINYQTLVYAIFILLVLFLLPTGVNGGVIRLKNWLARKLKGGRTNAATGTNHN